MLGIRGRRRPEDDVQEADVLQALRQVRDPDLHRDVVTLGFVKNVRICGGAVALDLELTTPACPVRDRLRAEAEAAVAAIPGVTQVTVNLTSRVRSRQGQAASELPGVRNIVAIASGKGGVGKSTAAVSLAVALAETGAKVGLMDADVYGPTIPTMMGAFGRPSTSGQRMAPIQAYGVRLMSLGFLAGDDSPIIWRGPMASKLIQEFLGSVDWGELDYLLIDLPPGTGDVQLTLVQAAPISGAVIVTTPQDVALSIARRGLRMFQETSVPVLGVIENMSGYVCPHCGKISYVFPHGGVARTCQEMGVPHLGAIPLDPKLAVCGDKGVPISVLDPDSPAAKAYAQIAGAMAARLSALAEGSLPAPTRPVRMQDRDGGALEVEWEDGHVSVYPYRELRAACRCANCCDEDTGEVRIASDSIPADIRPLSISPVGRYAITIRWSDGHDTGIYPFSRLRAMCGCAECTGVRNQHTK